MAAKLGIGYLTLFFWFLTELDLFRQPSHFVAHPAEPSSLLVWVFSSYHMIFRHPSHPVSAPILMRDT